MKKTFYSDKGLKKKKKSYFVSYWFSTDMIVSFCWQQVPKCKSCQPKSSRSGFSSCGMRRCFCHAYVMRTKTIGQSQAWPCSGTRFAVLHPGNTRFLSILSMCMIFINICTQSTWKISYAVVMLTALGIKHVRILSTVDNVNGLCVFVFFYLSNCIFLS